MQKNTFSAASMVSGCLSLILMLVALYAMLAWGRIQDFETFPVSLIFALINLVCVVAVAFLSRMLVQSITFVNFVYLSFITGLYTLAQFIHLGFAFRFVSVQGYTFFHLIVFLLYLVLASAVILNGHRRAREDASYRA